MARSTYPSLPPHAREAAYDALKLQGFPREMIEENYGWTNFSIDALVYTHTAYRSPDYTGVAIDNYIPNGITEIDIVEKLSPTAAPFSLIHNGQNETYSLWFTQFKNNKPFPLLTEKEIHYEQLTQVIQKYKVDLQPKKINDVKQGKGVFQHFEQANSHQLALWAVEASEKLLVEKFGSAVNDLRQQNSNNEIVEKIAIATLALIILEDTGALPPSQRGTHNDVATLFKVAHERFPRYFDLNLFTTEQNGIESCYQILNELSYGGFAPELLAALYRKAYPEKQERRELGRFDTPLYLTRRIWEAIPIEYLRPEHRIVADLSCGWGSFLLSAHERLSSLTDMREQPLRKHLFGNDQDTFTAKLAGLSLLTATREDSWQISNNDGMLWEPPKKPHLIVGNPPFGGNRKTTERGAHSKRHEKANGFLDRAVDLLAEGGYLAMIMPQSFIASEAGIETRQKLLTSCDILELWELPIGVFEAQANTVVLFAQKQQKNSINFPVPIRMVEKSKAKEFEKDSHFSTIRLILDIEKSIGKKSDFLYDFILTRHQWDSIDRVCIHLGEVANLFDGLGLGKKTENKRYLNALDSIMIEWYKKANLLEPYRLHYSGGLPATYPNDFENPRIQNRQLFTQQKVVINTLINASWGQRIKAAIDRRGVYLSDNFRVIALLSNNKYPQITDEVIVAILNWRVCNAWLLEKLKHTKPRIERLRRLPIPILSSDECKTIEQAVLLLENPMTSPELCQESQKIIDEILVRAYQLTPEVNQRLIEIIQWEKKHVVTADDLEKKRWNLCGAVEAVDSESGKITLWLRGFDELQIVPIAPSMPGWLLRPNATFCTTIPRHLADVKYLGEFQEWGIFYPQEYAYMDEEELLESLFE